MSNDTEKSVKTLTQNKRNTFKRVVFIGTAFDVKNTIWRKRYYVQSVPL